MSRATEYHRKPTPAHILLAIEACRPTLSIGGAHGIRASSPAFFSSSSSAAAAVADTCPSSPAFFSSSSAAAAVADTCPSSPAFVSSSSAAAAVADTCPSSPAFVSSSSAAAAAVADTEVSGERNIESIKQRPATLKVGMGEGGLQQRLGDKKLEITESKQMATRKRARDNISTPLDSPATEKNVEGDVAPICSQLMHARRDWIRLGRPTKTGSVRFSEELREFDKVTFHILNSVISRDDVFENLMRAFNLHSEVHGIEIKSYHLIPLGALDDEKLDLVAQKLLSGDIVIRRPASKEAPTKKTVEQFCKWVKVMEALQKRVLQLLSERNFVGKNAAWVTVEKKFQITQPKLDEWAAMCGDYLAKLQWKSQKQAELDTPPAFREDLFTHCYIALGQTNRNIITPLEPYHVVCLDNPFAVWAAELALNKLTIGCFVADLRGDDVRPNNSEEIKLLLEQFKVATVASSYLVLIFIRRKELLHLLGHLHNCKLEDSLEMGCYNASKLSNSCEDLVCAIRFGDVELPESMSLMLTAEDEFSHHDGMVVKYFQARFPSRGEALPLSVGVVEYLVGKLKRENVVMLEYCCGGMFLKECMIQKCLCIAVVHSDQERKELVLEIQGIGEALGSSFGYKVVVG